MEFADVAREHGPSLVRVAYLLCHDSGRAEDLAQEALMKAHTRWIRRGAPDHPGAYLRRIVVTEYLGWRRRRASTEHVGVDLEDVPATPGDATADVDARDLAWRLMAGLPPRQRAVLVLRYYEALPDREIAELIGVGEATVRSLASRAFTTLRTHPTSPILQILAVSRRQDSQNRRRGVVVTSWEDLVRDTLAERAHDVDGVTLVATAPPRRTGRRWVAVGTVVAVAAAILVAVVLVAPWRGGSDRNAVGEIPTPPAGMQWVSYHGITLTVPRTWTTGTSDCVESSAPGRVVVGVSGEKCVARQPAAQVTVYLSALGDLSPEGTTVDVGGKPAIQYTTYGGASGLHTALPAAGVVVYLAGPSTDRDQERDILDDIEYTPVDHHGCASLQPVPSELGTPGPVASPATSSAAVCDYSADDGGEAGARWLLGSRPIDDGEIRALHDLVARADPASPTVHPVVYGPGSSFRLFVLRRPDGTSLTLVAAFDTDSVVVSDGRHDGAVAGVGPGDLPAAYPS